MHTRRRLETSDIFRGGAAAAGRAVDDPGGERGGVLAAMEERARPQEFGICVPVVIRWCMLH